MTWQKIFIAVSCGAIAGMVMGGAFGFGAGKVTPDFFKSIIPWKDIEPVGAATFFGATTGVLLGGGLAAFGILVQTLLAWMKRDK